MENLDASELPSDKDSQKYFLLSENPTHSLPFKIMPLSILTPNGQKLVNDFRATKGEFLGGGVMKSDDFERDARNNSNALSIRRYMEMQISAMPKSEQIKMSTQITSEWIAFEYALVISQTLYGHITSIKWDQIDQIEISKKGFFGQAIAQIIFKDKKGQTQVKKIQSSAMNLASLRDIAKACKVNVK